MHQIERRGARWKKRNKLNGSRKNLRYHDDEEEDECKPLDEDF